MEGAVQRVQMAARSAAERTVDSLGLAASSSNNVFQRDSLLGAQFELNRKLAIFALTFNETLDRRVAREVGSRDPGSDDPSATRWDALSLVDDHEVEIQVSADRFALEIAHACEWEIRELDGYMEPLLGSHRGASERNPLRPEIVGQAMIRAVESVADRPDVRKVLGVEISRSLAHAMRQTYLDIVADLRTAGLKPSGLTVRQNEHNGADSGRRSGPGSLHSQGGPGGRGEQQGGPDHQMSQSGRLSPRGPSSGSGNLGHGGGSRATDFGAAEGATLGQIDPGLMALIRRLSVSAPQHSGWGSELSSGAASGHSDWDRAGGGPMAPNLIVAHREELRQAATGSLDHMVIDVVGSLFDQILSDPKVAPQMARQIARLQLPVLRAALGDRSFFSSRRHPVRRFINRIASLGCAWEDYDSEEARAFLMHVRELVQEVVEGDFDQIGLYEKKLDALQAFVAEQVRQEVHDHGETDTLLARKEDQIRVGQRYVQQLEGAMQALPMPEFLRDFLGKTWSQAIAAATLDPEADAGLAARMRGAARELVLSVQPKGDLEQRKAFLKSLPQLMKDISAGLDRLQVPEATRRTFFGQLLPAHAEALKGQALRTLDFNLLTRQVDTILATPMPKAADLPRQPPSALPVLDDVVQAPTFSPEEAKTIGLIDEKAVDWSGKIDIDLGAEPEMTAADVRLDGLPDLEPVEATRGQSLADNVQIGFAYQMHLESGWNKVRLTHVSPGRSFFVFSHGSKQRRTISMTYRMLSRLCETGRLRAYENAYLLERATARARRQLAALKPAAHAPALARV